MTERSATSNAKTTQFRMLTAVMVVIIILFGGFVWLLSNQTKEEDKSNEKINFSNPLDHADSETMVLELIQKSVKEIKEDNENFKKHVSEKMDPYFTNEKERNVETRLSALENKFLEKQQPTNLTAISENKLNGSEAYQETVTSLNPMYPEEMPQETLREDRFVLSPSPDAIAKKHRAKTPDSYVPAGTFVQGVVLEGADASTAVTSQSNPEPMLIRLISNGTLPNYAHSHLKDCIVTAAATGDISSERGKIRTERMSCVGPSGQILDIEVEGNVADSDGKNGMRGHLREGGAQYAARAFAAGALQGISEGFAQNYTINSVSPEGNVQSINSSKVLQYGGAKGASKAMDKLADYSIKRAEQFQPVVQLSAGRVVDVVFLKGFYLEDKEQSEEGKDSLPPVFGSFSEGEFPHQAERNFSSVEQMRALQQQSKNLENHVRQFMPPGK